MTNVINNVKLVLNYNKEAYDISMILRKGGSGDFRKYFSILLTLEVCTGRANYLFCTGRAEVLAFMPGLVGPIIFFVQIGPGLQLEFLAHADLFFQSY